MQIRLATWNLHTPPFAPRRSQRLRAAARHLRDEPDPKPDLLLFQEVWSETFWKELGQALSPDYAPSLPGEGAGTAARSGLASFVRRDSGWRVAGHRFERFHSKGPPWRIWEGDGLAEKGFEIDRRRVEIDPIKSVGEHTVRVKLHRDVVASLVLEVSAEGAPPPPDPLDDVVDPDDLAEAAERAERAEDDAGEEAEDDADL